MMGGSGNSNSNRLSMRLSMLHKRSSQEDASPNNNNNNGSLRSLTSASMGSSARFGNGSKSSFHHRMHESIQSAIAASEWNLEEEDSSQLDSDEEYELEEEEDDLVEERLSHGDIASLPDSMIDDMLDSSSSSEIMESYEFRGYMDNLNPNSSTARDNHAADTTREPPRARFVMTRTLSPPRIDAGGGGATSQRKLLATMGVGGGGGGSQRKLALGGAAGSGGGSKRNLLAMGGAAGGGGGSKRNLLAMGGGAAGGGGGSQRKLAMAVAVGGGIQRKLLATMGVAGGGGGSQRKLAIGGGPGGGSKRKLAIWGGGGSQRKLVMGGAAGAGGGSQRKLTVSQYKEEEDSSSESESDSDSDEDDVTSTKSNEELLADESNNQDRPSAWQQYAAKADANRCKSGLLDDDDSSTDDGEEGGGGDGANNKARMWQQWASKADTNRASSLLDDDDDSDDDSNSSADGEQEEDENKEEESKGNNKKGLPPPGRQQNLLDQDETKRRNNKRRQNRRRKNRDKRPNLESEGGGGGSTLSLRASSAKELEGLLTRKSSGLISLASLPGGTRATLHPPGSTGGGVLDGDPGGRISSTSQHYDDSIIMYHDSSTTVYSASSAAQQQRSTMFSKGTGGGGSMPRAGSTGNLNHLLMQTTAKAAAAKAAAAGAAGSVGGNGSTGHSQGGGGGGSAATPPFANRTVLSRHISIAPESSKLRGGNSREIVTPLPVRLSRLGLFGRDAEIKLLKDCLYKYEWASNNKKKNKKNNNNLTPSTTSTTTTTNTSSTTTSNAVPADATATTTASRTTTTEEPTNSAHPHQAQTQTQMQTQSAGSGSADESAKPAAETNNINNQQQQEEEEEEERTNVRHLVAPSLTSGDGDREGNGGGNDDSGFHPQRRSTTAMRAATTGLRASTSGLRASTTTSAPRSQRLQQQHFLRGSTTSSMIRGSVTGDHFIQQQLQQDMIGTTPRRQSMASIRPSTARRKNKRYSITGKIKPPPSQKRQFVCIGGASGCGKSALVDFALHKEVSKLGGLYVTGKFENQLKTNNNHPFAGLASACDDLCVQLLALHSERQEDYNNLLQSLRKQLSKEEATLLLRLVPGLGPILESLVITNDLSSSSAGGRSKGGEMKDGSGSSLRARIRTCGDRRVSTRPRVSTSPRDSSNSAEDMDNSIAQRRRSTRDRLQNLVHGLVPYNQEESDGRGKKFQFVLHKFLHIVGAGFPLVLVLDDLQWADTGSLELLEILVVDRLSFSSNLMVIGLYRDDEVDDKHPLTELKREVASKTEAGTCLDLNIVDLTLKSLTSNDLTQLLSKLLQQEQSETDSLAELIHRKVGGNAFFFVRFITMLWQEELIRYDLVAESWVWDEKEIDDRSLATENVINFLQERLSSLPDNAKQLLLFASCLGTEFDLTSMKLIMDDFYPDVSFDQLEKDLQLCLKEGVLEVCSSDDERYRWVHDKLMEAAQSMLRREELPKLKFCVGAVLLKYLEEQPMEDELFLIANLLNEAPSLSDTPRSMAELNLRAARKAASLSSFHAAADYCAQGISLLPPDKWTTDFDLALQLHSAAAHMYSTLGEYEAMEKECNEILSRSDVHVLDKIRPYEFLMDSICYRGRLPEAITMVLDVLRQLGVTFPKNTLLIRFKVARGLNEAIKKVDSRCEKLRKIPLLDDARHKAAMRFLGKLAKFAHLGKSPLLPLATLKMAKYSLEHGLANDSPKSIAYLGMIIGAFRGDIQTGSKYGNLALQLLHRLPGRRRMLPEVAYMAFSHVLHNTQPLHLMLKPLLHAYNISLEYGSTEYACFSIYHYLLIAFRSGKGLAAIEIDLRAYTKQMVEMQIDKMIVLSRMLWQLVMNLMDFPDTTPLVLTGEAMDELQFLASEKSNAYYFTMFQSYQTTLYALLGKHELGARLSLTKADMLSAHPGSPSVVMDTFYQGVSLFAAARANNNKKYATAAKKMLAKIDGWAKTGNPNVLHLSSFLSAEKAALKGRREEAEKFYETAIVTASKQGFLQYAALANERLAELYENELKDKSSAGFRMQEAIRLYSDWGAHRKATMLQEAKADLLRWCATSHHPDEICLDIADSSSVGTGKSSLGLYSFGGFY